MRSSFTDRYGPILSRKKCSPNASPIWEIVLAWYRDIKPEHHTINSLREVKAILQTGIVIYSFDPFRQILLPCVGNWRLSWRFEDDVYMYPAWSLWVRGNALEIIGGLLMASTSIPHGRNMESESIPWGQDMNIYDLCLADCYNAHLDAIVNVIGYVPASQKRFALDAVLSAAENLTYEENCNDKFSVAYEVIQRVIRRGNSRFLRPEYVSRMFGTLDHSIENAGKSRDFYRVYGGIWSLVELHKVFPQEVRSMAMEIWERKWIKICDIDPNEHYRYEISEPVFRLFSLLSRPVTEEFLREIRQLCWGLETDEDCEPFMMDRKQLYEDFRYLCRISDISDDTTSRLIEETEV